MAGTRQIVTIQFEGESRDATRAARDVEKALKGVGQTGDRVGGQLSKVGDSARRGLGVAMKAGALAAGAAIAALAVGAKKAVDAASNLEEQMNKTRTVFKGGAGDVLAFSKTTASGLGISQRAALEAAGTFGNMLVPMGFARKEAAGMSTSMVKLAADMASFNNASPEETLDALRAGLAGETEPLRRFGVFLNDARIKQEALSLGLTKGADAAKAAAAALSAAEKQVAAATKERTASVKAVEAAEKAREAASARVVAATDQLSAAHERVTQAQQRVQDSTETVTAAKDRLRDAQERGRSAQERLTEARKEAVRQLDEMRDSARDAALSEEGAEIRLARARERLVEVMKTANASELDRREALLSVKEAEAGLEEAQERRTDATTELTDAEKRGVAGSKEVVAARNAARDAAKSVDAAERSVAKAVREQADAQRALIRSQGDAVRAQEMLLKARQSAAATEERLEAAQVRAQKAVRDLQAAQAGLASAQERSAKAGKVNADRLTAQEKAMATYSIIMKDTKDTQGDFARTSDSLANQQRVLTAELEEAAASMGKALLPAAAALVKVFGDLIPKLSALGSELADRLGPAIEKAVGFVRSLVSAFSGPGGLGTSTDGARSTLSSMADVMRRIAEIVGPPLARIVKTLATELGQTFKVAVAAAKEVFAAFAKVLKDNEPAIKRIAERFADVLVPALKALGWVIREVVYPVVRDVLVKLVIPAFGLTVKAIDKVSGAVEGIVKAFRTAGTSIATFMTNITTRAKAFGTTVAALIKAPINAVIKAINALRIPSWKIKYNLPGKIPDINFATPAIDPIPNIKALAEGGIVRRPTVALIGERGPEAVVPLSGRNAGLGGVTININAPFYGDEEKFGRAVVSAMERHQIRNGSVPRVLRQGG